MQTRIRRHRALRGLDQVAVALLSLEGPHHRHHVVVGAEPQLAPRAVAIDRGGVALDVDAVGDHGDLRAPVSGRVAERTLGFLRRDHDPVHHAGADAVQEPVSGPLRPEQPSMPELVLLAHEEGDVLERPPDADAVAERHHQETKRPQPARLHDVDAVLLDDPKEVAPAPEHLDHEPRERNDAVFPRRQDHDGYPEPLDVRAERTVGERAHDRRTPGAGQVPRHRHDVLLRAADVQVRHDLQDDGTPRAHRSVPPSARRSRSTTFGCAATHSACSIASTDDASFLIGPLVSK